MENTALVVLALLLVLLNGFFVASEFAIVKLRATRVDELKKLHGWRGRILAVVHQQLDAYLSACQLGITLASLGLGWIGEPAFALLLEAPAEWLGLDVDPAKIETAAFIFAFSLISFLHIVVGELAPKSMAIRRPETVSLWTAVPLWVFYWAMYPFIWALNTSANAILRIAGLGGAVDHTHENHYSRAELRTILHQSRPQLEGAERAISSVVSHALELPDLHVSDLMRPIDEMVSIPAGSTHDRIRALILQHQYSRYPVLGRPSEILGVLHIKDIYTAVDGPDYFTRLQKSMHQPLIVTENSAVQEVLRLFQQGISHFAVVHDRRGAAIGFLTLEDVLETIFGEITDEHEPLRKHQARRDPRWEGEGKLLVRGDTALFRVEREIGRAINGSAEISTLSGFLMQKLDRAPKADDVLEHDGLKFQVVKAHGPRAEWIRISSADPATVLSQEEKGSE